jgi:hypothetical protein
MNNLKKPHEISVPASTLMHMRMQDVAIFAEAAKFYNVYIGVRRTNPASLAYIDKAGYSAKRLDCKPKTADRNFVDGTRVYKTAGLVVDPYLVGERAFEGGKYQEAKKQWDKFKDKLAAGLQNPDGSWKAAYFPGKFYTVQTDRNHVHYGCLMFSEISSVAQATYVHGDYDLYAVIPNTDRGRTTFVTETRLGEEHARSKELIDVQTYVNKRIGRPMILHGDQEKFKDHTEETVDFFLPDGMTVRAIAGAEELRRLYRQEFSGRMTGDKYAVPPAQRNQFVTVPR